MSGKIPSCNFCNRSGLFIMPARYAIAPLAIDLDKKEVPAQAPATAQQKPQSPERPKEPPRLEAPLQVADFTSGHDQPQNLNLSAAAYYTTRLLRAGYLYVYYQNIDKFDIYAITRDGYYKSLSEVESCTAEDMAAQPCSVGGHVEIASCISIRNAATAGVIWMGFSDVLWTEAVREAHRGAAGRAKREAHMRRFDVSAWAKTHKLSATASASARGSVAHAVPLSALAETISEYAPSADSSHESRFAYRGVATLSLHQKQDKAASTVATLRALSMGSKESSGSEGAIVVLDDPAGMAQDLGHLLGWHQKTFLEMRVEAGSMGQGYGHYTANYARLLEVESCLQQIRSVSDQKIEMAELDMRVARADYVNATDDKGRVWRPEMRVNAMPARFVEDRKYEKEEAEKTARMVIPSPDIVAKQQDQAWAKLTEGKLNTAIREAWQAQYQTRLQALTDKVITPLGNAHSAWMRSNLLANKLEHTHDGESALSGEVYTETVQRCLQNTTDIQQCNKVYSDWLKGDIRQPNNLLLRAMVLRQNKLIDMLANVTLEQTDIPWEALHQQYQAVIEKVLHTSCQVPQPAQKAQQELMQQSQEAQQKVAEAKRAHEEAQKALQAYENAAKPGARILISPPFVAGVAVRSLPDARSRVEQTQKHYAEMQTEADKKAALMVRTTTNATASLLAQAGAATIVNLYEFNASRLSGKLSRWMLVQGVAVGQAYALVTVKGTVAQSVRALTRHMMRYLSEAAIAGGKPMSQQQISELSTFAERQVISRHAKGNLPLYYTKANSTQVEVSMLVVVTDDTSEAIRNIKSPSERVRYLSTHVKTFEDLEGIQLWQAESLKPRLKLGGTAIAVAMQALFEMVSWQGALEAEARALSFEKGWQQDMRMTVMTSLHYSVYGLSVTQLAKGTAKAWYSRYATGMSGQPLVKTMIGLGAQVMNLVAGVLTAMLATMDLVEGAVNVGQGRENLGSLQIGSGVFGLVASSSAISVALIKLRIFKFFGIGTRFLTGVGIVATVVAVSLDWLANEKKGTEIQRWLERCYWGTESAKNRYAEVDKKTEIADFKLALELI